MERPNVLVVLSDQQRHDTCGCYGQRLPVTPRLDALAADGVVAETAFAVQPLCGPSRASIQTGAYPTRTGTWRNGLALPSTVPTIATVLGAAGYWCGYVGKWHLASTRGSEVYRRRPVPRERRGGYLDAWLAADALEHTSGPYRGHVWDREGRRVRLHGYRVDAVTDLAIEALQSRDRAKPFLLFVSHLEPHHQNNRLRYVGPRGRRQAFRHYDVPGDLRGRVGDWRWSYPDYLAACSSVDANLGRLVDHLAAEGPLDDTLIVFASDHGNHFRTRNLEYKRSVHDASIRVPLVLRGPGFRGGNRLDGICALVDLLPTIARAAAASPGVDVPVDGRALQDLVAGTPTWRSRLLVQVSESEVGRALRTKGWKYGVTALDTDPRSDPSAMTYTESVLYDLDADPHERTNLIRDPSMSATRHELRAELAGAMVDAGEAEPRIDPPRSRGRKRSGSSRRA